MDLRKERIFRPETKGLRLAKSPYSQDQHSYSAVQQSHQSLPNQESLVYNQVRKISPSNEDEMSHQIELRHEELKRQIALKEQQLANITGDRLSTNRVRQSLGLNQKSQESKKRLGLGQSFQNDSRKQLFPQQKPNQMVGLRSTFAHKQGLENSLGQNIQPEISDQQIYFNPTRQPRAEKMSPLRKSKSRSKSRELAPSGYTLNSSIASFANQNQISRYTGISQTQNQETGISPYYSKQENSPLRQKSPQIEIINQNQNIHSMRDFTQAAQTAAGQSAAAPVINNFGGGILGVSNQRDQLYRDRIEAMTLDNQSLQRRLNQVTKELDRLSREKEEINRNLKQCEINVNNYDNIINTKDDIDTQNHLLSQEMERIKETNSLLDISLKNEESATAKTGDKIVHTTSEHKNLALDKDYLERDLKDKLGLLDSLLRVKTKTQNELNSAQNQLQILQNEEIDVRNNNEASNDQIVKLQNEKRDLLRNLENLTVQYDNCVRIITDDRRNMDQSNDWNSKVLLAKIIFNNLEICQRARSHNAFTEIIEYSKFDGDCHSKLKIFSNVLYKVGCYKQGVALNRWYINSLRPLKTRRQNFDISIQINCNKLVSKVFYAWKQFQRDKMDSYHFRTAGIQRIWHMLARGSKHELKRAIDIWKQKKSFYQYSLTKFKKLMKQRNDTYLRQAIYTWRHYSLTVDSVCRVKVLQVEYTQKMF